MRINASLIKQYRSDKSWTQQHLADACGVSLRTVQRVERYGTASNETLMALASVFEVEQVHIQESEVETALVEAPKIEDAKSNWLTSHVISALMIGFIAGMSVVLVVQ